MPSSRVTAGVRRKASTPLLKMGRPPSAAKGAAVCCGGAGVPCGGAVQNEELLEHGSVVIVVCRRALGCEWGEGRHGTTAPARGVSDELIREDPANRGTETSAEVLVGPPWRIK